MHVIALFCMLRSRRNAKMYNRSRTKEEAFPFEVFANRKPTEYNKVTNLTVIKGKTLYINTLYL